MFRRPPRAFFSSLLLSAAACVLLFHLPPLPPLSVAALRAAERRPPTVCTADGRTPPPPGPTTFDPLAWPAILINHPNATTWRRWSEAQLADLGYATYTRVDGRVLPESLRSCADCWQDGLTMAHVAAWERAAAHVPPPGAPAPRGFLILEDDVVFHGNFLGVWPAYDAALRAAGPFSLLYVGQWSHYEDSAATPRPELVEGLDDAAAPWTTHAYVVAPAAAALLARFARFVLARGGAPLRDAPFVFEDFLPAAPWRLGPADTKVDFLLRTVHHYFFRAPPPQRPFAAGPVLPQWRALRSTRAQPAALGAAHRWTQHGGITLAAGEGGCGPSSPGFVACEAPGAREAPCGLPSGRLPVMGTGLAYQNQCKVDPFMLRVWTGEAPFARVPSCGALFARIRPAADSDTLPAAPPCMDEPAFAVDGGSALPWPAFALRHGAALRGAAAGAPPLPVAVHVQALPCACSGGGGGGGGAPCIGCCLCEETFFLRPGSTDAAVLEQVVAAPNRYGFLRALGLPPPAAVLDAGANCGVAALAFGALFPLATIVAVEADGGNYEALLRNVGGKPRVQPVLGALWGVAGAPLTLQAGSRSGREWDRRVVVGAVASGGGGGGGGEAAPLTGAVEALTVAGLGARFNLAFDFVKLDVEGAERSVFDRAGGADLGWLAGVAYLAVELHDDVAPGARKAVEGALGSVGGAWCHAARSGGGEGGPDVWVNEDAPLTRDACAARRARGGSCCGEARVGAAGRAERVGRQ